MSKSQYVEMVKARATDAELEPFLLAGICEVESSWNPWAVRYEPLFLYFSNLPHFASLNGITIATEKAMQQFSYGLGQIMGGTARGLGFTGPLGLLYEPLENLTWCAKQLKQLSGKYHVVEDIISAYNAGHPTPNNKEYVTRVLAAMARGALS